MRTFVAATLALAAAGNIAGAQTIDPGMSRDQVVAKLGKPLTERAKDGKTYIFYDNKMTNKVGMNDLVVLENDKVVDAIFRSNERHFSGTSSSPSAIPSDVAYWGKNPPPAKAKAAPAATKTAAPAGKQASPPAKAAPSTKTAPANAKTAPATKTAPPPAAKSGITPTKTPPPPPPKTAAPTTKKADTATKKAPPKKP